MTPEESQSLRVGDRIMTHKTYYRAPLRKPQKITSITRVGQHILEVAVFGDMYRIYIDDVIANFVLVSREKPIWNKGV